MKSINFRVLIAVLVVTGSLLATGLWRLEFDADIVRSLPDDSAVVSDALDIFAGHPVHDQIAVDLALNEKNPDLLVKCGQYLEQRLRESGLFKEVGNEKIAGLMPDLISHVVNNLPILFSETELNEIIAPRLTAEAVEKRMLDNLGKLSGLEGIGGARFIGSDPLGFMEPVMARMALMSPLPDSQFYRGFLFSADREHLLVTARPLKTGTDTGGAEEISAVLAETEKELRQQYGGDKIDIVMTPVGAYRAALDNERIIRHDVNFAIVISMLGIGILLLMVFPRPVIGMFSFLPAIFGTALALFVFSLFHPSISVMVLGFGGAIISITVDHGIACLLFLDRLKTGGAMTASHEARALGMLPVLTTCGAFISLGCSGFPVFVQLGQFTAMGVMFSFMFVHLVFPRLFPGDPPAARERKGLQRLVNFMYGGGRVGFTLASVLALVLLVFARPDFQVNLESMNTVSNETMMADKRFTSVWGDMGQRVVLMLSATGIQALANQNDILRSAFAADGDKFIAPVFVPSMLFPGEVRAAENLEAWHDFWGAGGGEKLRELMAGVGADLGFSDDAFLPFFDLLEGDYAVSETTLAPQFFPLFGITENNGEFTEFINISPGNGYNSAWFYGKYREFGRIFDGPWFAEELADILYTSFTRMFAVIAVSITLFLLVLYASLPLTIISLLPPLFAYVCTLGTMKLIAHPVDIPGIMLSIVILGMGVDYSIFFVRAHQRYRDDRSQSFGLVRMTVFMAGVSTMIGFGVLCFAEHSLLRSIGVTSLLGIGYSLLGAFLLLPPLLRYYFSGQKSRFEGSDLKGRVRFRYRLLEAYPRMFARFKMISDPMFTDLEEILAKFGIRVRSILDIGCGYGVPGCWCLEYYPQARLVALDPDSERVRVAVLAMGERGRVLCAGASELPELSEPADLVLLLDMLHYLDDGSVQKLLADCKDRMAAGGLLLIRYVIYPVDRQVSWSWRLEDLRIRAAGGSACYREPDKMKALLQEAGFLVDLVREGRHNSELIWIVGRAVKK